MPLSDDLLRQPHTPLIAMGKKRQLTADGLSFVATLVKAINCFLPSVITSGYEMSVRNRASAFGG